MGHGSNPFPKSCIHTSAHLGAWLLFQQSAKSTSVNSGVVEFSNCFTILSHPSLCANLTCSLLLVFSSWDEKAVQIETTGSRSGSDGHDFGLLGCEQLVDLLHEFVGELLS